MKNLRKKIDKFSLYCFIDEVLFISSTKHFWYCECPVYSHKSGMKIYCDTCLLYRDLCIFSLNLMMYYDMMYSKLAIILHYFLTL